MSADKLRIGFIPLADATALLIAVDKGFTAAEGLEVELVQEVSWSNVRDKLNIGLFDAAHPVNNGGGTAPSVADLDVGVLDHLAEFRDLRVLKHGEVRGI